MNQTQKLIQPKMGLLKLAEKLGNVSEACKVMGYSRDSNENRTHSGRYCYGKTPLQTWMDRKNLAKQKNIDLQFGQNPNFNVSDQTEKGSAGGQPVRDRLISGNEKSDANHTSDFLNSFSL